MHCSGLFQAIAPLVEAPWLVLLYLRLLFWIRKLLAQIELWYFWFRVCSLSVYCGVECGAGPFARANMMTCVPHCVWSMVLSQRVLIKNMYSIESENPVGQIFCFYRGCGIFPSGYVHIHLWIDLSTDHPVVWWINNQPKMGNLRIKNGGHEWGPGFTCNNRQIQSH
jgi:hypothetical protein